MMKTVVLHNIFVETDTFYFSEFYFYIEQYTFKIEKFVKL